MKKPLILVILIVFCGVLTSVAQDYYWVAFSDKNNSPWSLSEPEKYLSERSIRRRIEQNIEIDSLDLPVNPLYISQTLDLGAEFIHSSKWLNGITVRATSPDFLTDVKQLPFVREVKLSKRTAVFKSAVAKFQEPDIPLSMEGKLSLNYGESSYQIEQLNTQFFHQQNFRGERMQIAVLDAGFFNVDIYPAFDSLWANHQILGVKNFVDENSVFDNHSHGMSVLSAIGGNVPEMLLGTAPKASFWLIQTEDAKTEFIIEEDNWIAGAEFADSVGVDIINSSLGYYMFDDPAMNHSYSDMDGNTTRITRGANIAASRGILVFASAGNEGNNQWKHIIAPSDGDSVIGVGAVNRDGRPAAFTSHGPAADGKVKPNVSAIGWNTVIVRGNGDVVMGNGTSYSSPVMAGAAACLWQANPEASAHHVKRAIEQSAHLFDKPDSLVGYGIPDLKIADLILKNTFVDKLKNGDTWQIYPNPAKDYIVLQKNEKVTSSKVQIGFYSTDGRLLRKEETPDAVKILLQNLHTLPPGIVILQIVTDDATDAVKIAINLN